MPVKTWSNHNPHTLLVEMGIDITTLQNRLSVCLWQAELLDVPQLCPSVRALYNPLPLSTDKTVNMLAFISVIRLHYMMEMKRFIKYSKGPKYGLVELVKN